MPGPAVVSTNNRPAQTGGPGRQGCPGPGPVTALLVGASRSGHATARPHLAGDRDPPPLPRPVAPAPPPSSGSPGRWALRQHTQRKRGWRQGLQVPIGPDGVAQRLPPAEAAGLGPSITEQGLWRWAGLDLSPPGLRLSRTSSPPRPQCSRSASFTWKSYRATMFSCFNS